MRRARSHRHFPWILTLALLAASCGEKSGGDGDPGSPMEQLRRYLDDPANHRTIVPEAPLGISANLARLIPADNPMTPAKIELGRQLYFDPRLSKDGTVSCATCHDPEKGFGDGGKVSTGIAGQKGGRSAPTIINRILAPVQFWDGRAASLEEQALGPIGNPIEMGSSPEEAAKVLAGIEGYVLQFEKIFGGGPTPDRIAKAIATFERTVLSGASPYDYWMAARPWRENALSEEELKDASLVAKRDKALADAAAHPLSEAAERGRQLFFGKGECSLCHVGENFSDEAYWNIGVGMAAEKPDLGRMVVSGSEKDRGAFRTPTVREIRSTAPYMHDGSAATLEEVVEHYRRGGMPNPGQSDRIKKLDLTDADVKDIAVFMAEGLSGTVTKVTRPQLP